MDQKPKTFLHQVFDAAVAESGRDTSYDQTEGSVLQCAIHHENAGVSESVGVYVLQYKDADNQLQIRLRQTFALNPAYELVITFQEWQLGRLTIVGNTKSMSADDARVFGHFLERWATLVQVTKVAA